MDARPNQVRGIGHTPAGKKPAEHTTTISNIIAVGLQRHLRKLGLDSESIFRAAGLKSEIFKDKYAQFPIEKMAVALQISARLSHDPCFGLHFGEWYRPRALIASNFAINSAPDIRNALTSFQIHSNLITGIPTQIYENREFAEMCWIINVSSAYSRQLIDFKAIRTLKIIQQAAGPEWRPLRVNMAYEKPENVDEYFRVLGPNVHFGQPVNSFQIDLDAMAIPMPDADPDIYHMARNSILNPYTPEQEDQDPVVLFRRFIHAQLGKNSVNMTSASQHLKMTPQQLRRLLKKSGTCFQCVLDETRKIHATHYLFETDTRFCEITYLLGFSNQSTFSRAVKRWFGTTPREVRCNFHQLPVMMQRI